MVKTGHASDAREPAGSSRSDGFGRAAHATNGLVHHPAGREEALFAGEFGQSLASIRPDGLEEGSGARSSGGDSGFVTAVEHGEERSTARSHRHGPPFGTIACLGALVAVVAVGIIAGEDHSPPNIAAQEQPHRSRPQQGSHRAGAGAPTAPTAPSGSFTAATGPGGGTAPTGSSGGLGSSGAPGGRVSLVGPATYTATPASPVAAGGAPGGDSGTGGSPPASGSPNPATPAAPATGSVVNSIGSTVTTAASQIESTIPAATSATGVVDSVADTLNQAVNAATG